MEIVKEVAVKAPGRVVARRAGRRKREGGGVWKSKKRGTVEGGAVGQRRISELIK